MPSHRSPRLQGWHHAICARRVSSKCCRTTTIPSGKTNGFTALISLYSWSYTYIPAEKVSVYDTLRNLGQSVQPSRLPDVNCNDPQGKTKLEKMIRQRIDAGYLLVNYRLRTGEKNRSHCVGRDQLVVNDRFVADWLLAHKVYGRPI